MFDAYVSLGEACEVAFQIRRKLGHDNSSFFSWKRFGPEALRSILQARFAGIFQDHNITYDNDRLEEHDASHGFGFHVPIDWEKTNYLIDKFLNPVGKRCYFYRVAEPIKTTELVVDESWGLEIRALLDTIHPDGNYQLVIIMPGHWPRPKDSERLAWRALKFIAPDYDQQAADIEGWDQIFGEFKHREVIEREVRRYVFS